MDINEKVNNLGRKNLEKVCHMVEDIDDIYQINLQDFLQIKMWTPTPEYLEILSTSHYEIEEAWEYRQEALNFLKGINAITKYEIVGDYEDVEPMVNIYLNPDVFQQIKNILPSALRNKTYLKTEEVETDANPVKDIGKPVYAISYTPAREIILNRFLLSKLNFDSENHAVFEYVYKHPNRDIPLAEIGKNLQGRELSKTLPKIVENWGFTGQLKKVFFDVSKSKIRFRNPVTNSDLRDLDIEHLRFPRSASSAE